MNANAAQKRVSTAPDGVDDAVGMERRSWYVAVVNNNSEKKVLARLEQAGYECYLPTQEEVRIWKDGRRRKTERVVIPATVFIRCTEPERREAVKLPFINRFMTDRASAAATQLSRPVAVIPDKQIDTLRFMLGNSDEPVFVTAVPYRRGDKVRVVRGGLAGLEGEVWDAAGDKGRSELLVRLDFFGCARLTINSSDVEIIK